jgi:hypothetical protein
MNSKWFRCRGLSRQGIAAFSSLALLLVASGPAWSAAMLEITLTDSRGGGPTTIVDGGAGDADGVINNSISVTSVVVGGYTFTGVLSTTNTPGVLGVAQVQDNFTVENTSLGGAGTASIYASSNGFTDPTGALAFQVTTATFLQNSGGSGVGTVTSFIAPNALTTVPTGVVAGSAVSPATTLAIPVTATSSGFIAPLPAIYALNLLLNIAMPGGDSNFSNTSQVSLFAQGRGPNPAPEPATMLMWGFGALGMVALRLRRRNS